MEPCTEVAIFKVEQKHKNRVLELSKLIFEEMNEAEMVISDYQLLVKTDNAEEVCWLVTWVSLDAAQNTTAKWPHFPSTKELESLVGENSYYGHFVAAF